MVIDLLVCSLAYHRMHGAIFQILQDVNSWVVRPQ